MAEQKPETAENWIDYFLNKENNTPIDMPQGELSQWQTWWDNSKMGNIVMPPHTTMSSVTESSAHIEVIKSTTVPMESKKTKKLFSFKKVPEKKEKESTAGGLLW